MRSWLSMRHRCELPGNNKFHLYGGRGIRVCERWLRFENFLADMGERPKGLTLDRIDPDGNYEPSNCRWATYAQQATNRRAPAPRSRPCRRCTAPFTAISNHHLYCGDVCRDAARAERAASRASDLSRAMRDSVEEAREQREGS